MGKHWAIREQAGQLVAAAMLRGFEKSGVPKSALLGRCLPQARAGYQYCSDGDVPPLPRSPGLPPEVRGFRQETRLAIGELLRPPLERARAQLTTFGVDVRTDDLAHLWRWSARLEHLSMDDAMRISDTLGGRTPPPAPLGELHILLRIEYLPTSRAMYSEAPALPVRRRK